MKLAEALALRADLVNRIKDNRHRAETTARFQEGDEPLESPIELHLTTIATINQLAKLIAQINHTNSVTKITVPGRPRMNPTISQALAERDAAAAMRDASKGLAEAANGNGGMFGYRRSRSEIKDTTNLDVPMLRTQTDDFSKTHRLLDTAIQQANWNTELIEE